MMKYFAIAVIFSLLSTHSLSEEKVCDSTLKLQYERINRDILGEFGEKSRKLCSYSYGEEWENPSILDPDKEISASTKELLNDFLDIVEYEFEIGKNFNESTAAGRAKLVADHIVEITESEKLDELRSVYYGHQTRAYGVCKDASTGNFEFSGIYCDENFTTDLMLPIARFARILQKYDEREDVVIEYTNYLEKLMASYDGQWRAFGGIGVSIEYVGQSYFSGGARIMHTNGLAIFGVLLVDLYYLTNDSYYLYRLGNIIETIKNSVRKFRQNGQNYCLWEYAADDPDGKKEDGNHGLAMLQLLAKLDAEPSLPEHAKFDADTTQSWVTTFVREGMTGDIRFRETGKDQLKTVDQIEGSVRGRAGVNEKPVLEICSTFLEGLRYHKELFRYCRREMSDGFPKTCKQI